MDRTLVAAGTLAAVLLSAAGASAARPEPGPAVARAMPTHLWEFKAPGESAHTTSDKAREGEADPHLDPARLRLCGPVGWLGEHRRDATPGRRKLADCLWVAAKTIQELELRTVLAAEALDVSPVARPDLAERIRSMRGRLGVPLELSESGVPLDLSGLGAPFDALSVAPASRARGLQLHLRLST